jgi:hypothetical protein
MYFYIHKTLNNYEQNILLEVRNNAGFYSWNGTGIHGLKHPNE